MVVTDWKQRKTQSDANMSLPPQMELEAVVAATLRGEYCDSISQLISEKECDPKSMVLIWVLKRIKTNIM